MGVTFKWQKVQVEAASDAAAKAQHFYGKLTTPNVSPLRLLFRIRSRYKSAEALCLSDDSLEYPPVYQSG